MSADNGDELTQILATHKEHVAAARMAAQQRAHNAESARHDCEAPLRRIAIPLLQEWSRQTGAKLEDGLREAPSWIAFARENGTVYHTYTVSAPDPFVAPYYAFLLERTPQGADESEPRAWRKDEYPETSGLSLQ